MENLWYISVAQVTVKLLFAQGTTLPLFLQLHEISVPFSFGSLAFYYSKEISSIYILTDFALLHYSSAIWVAALDFKSSLRILTPLKFTPFKRQISQLTCPLHKCIFSLTYILSKWLIVVTFYWVFQVAKEMIYLLCSSSEPSGILYMGIYILNMC